MSNLFESPAIVFLEIFIVRQIVMQGDVACNALKHAAKLECARMFRPKSTMSLCIGSLWLGNFASSTRWRRAAYVLRRIRDTGLNKNVLLHYFDTHGRRRFSRRRRLKWVAAICEDTIGVQILANREEAASRLKWMSRVFVIVSFA